MRVSPAGAALGALPGVALAAWAAARNPWFLDEPLLYAILAVLLPALALGLAIRRPGGRWPRLTLAAEAAVLAAASLRPLPDPVPVRLVVFGIDGATWAVADRLDLPALEGLQARGTRAVLRSEEPMFSPLLWTTIASGERPLAHGIHGFRTRSDQATAARFWEVAADSGLRVGIWKWLVTWPPRPLDGFVVPAWLAPAPDTWPAELSFVKELELSRRLKRKRVEGTRPGWRLALAGIPHGLRFSTLRAAAAWSVRERLSHPSDAERTRRGQLLRVRIDRDVFVASVHRWRPGVATFTTYATDALGHVAWGEPALDEAYLQADAVLGELLENVDATTVVVLSDHGFRAARARDADRAFAPTTERLRERILAEVGPADVARLGHKVVVALQAEDVPAERARLEAWLAGFLQGSTGAPFYRWETIDARSVGLTLREESVGPERLATDTAGGEPLASYVRATDRYTGEHDADGIFLAAGPGIPAGTRDPVDLADVAPTLLAALGLPAGEDMPGRAIFGEARPRVATWDAVAHGVVAPAPEGEAEVNEDALRALGYVE